MRQGWGGGEQWGRSWEEREGRGNMDRGVKSKQNKQPPQKTKKEKKPAVVSVGD